MKTRIILFLLLVVALSIITDSIPEAIGGLIAGIIAIFIGTIWYKLQVARGFNMRFSADPMRFDRSRAVRRHTKVWTVKPGERELLLRVMPNRGTRFERIGLHFVNKKNVLNVRGHMI